MIVLKVKKKYKNMIVLSKDYKIKEISQKKNEHSPQIKSKLTISNIMALFR